MTISKDKSYPLVSVGCAVFNGAKTLRRALDSLVEQDYPCLQIIICDDGSTDDSRTICREYAKLHSNIQYLENAENIGITENYNKLIHSANGKYFLFADQDDFREVCYISKCVSVLESDSEAVLCHSHTGVIWKFDNRLLSINTIDSIDNDSFLLRRYFWFLRRYSDTTIYGLIRISALRNTALWRPDVASANALLFELLLIGKFRQIPEVLYYYHGMGFKYRTTPQQDYANSNPGRTMPVYKFPFLTLAYNQSKGVLASRHGTIRKVLLLLMLWVNIVAVNSTKAAFRLLYGVFGGRIPKWFEKFCIFVVMDMSDIIVVTPPEEVRDCYPIGWPLLKREQWKYDQ
jgi:glycosyltransferase involved in cell wall biosynthesis